ncbi:hypothetical protein Q8A67_005687 [Cirrhinus molitorella]|uniref:Uncharacterized protein n=1 Tax=Cirrhinus molitorella TaxID=172907 RepID=A0AA88PYW1_9TELE|nr:hypothetical protein Q8A67_005687 [Cirrhinus molitorella]
MENVFSVFLTMFVINVVFGVDPDGVKTVIEGDSLTLLTDFTEMQKDGLTEWKVNNTYIATINKGTGKVEYSDDKLMMMFSGRLNLDQTGFLTIWNIRIKHSGEYKVESSSSAGSKSKTFKVIVKESPLKYVEDKDEIKVLSATKGNSENLHTETELQIHDLVLWRFGAEGSLIAKSDTEENHASYYDDGRFGGKLELDSKTGSLTITDIETKHTGEFRLKIISDRRILFKRFIVTVSALGLSPGAVAAICVVILLVAAAAIAAGVVMYFRSDNYKVKQLMSKIFKQLEQLSKISEQLEQLREINISERLSEISEKLKKTYEGKKSEQLHNVEISKQETHGNVTQEETSGSEIREDLTDDVKISEQETHSYKSLIPGADVTQEETKRHEIKDGEQEIYVQETAISKAIGADNRLRDRQGKKSLVIRKTNTAVQTQEKEVNEETPFMSQKEEDEPNE